MDRVSCFISHAGADRAWAEWVAWQLTDAGHSVELDVWDWAAGQNFITKISDALERADRVVALWSAEYFNRSRYTTEEWSAALADLPGQREGRLVPLRVEDVSAELVPGILRSIMYRDLFDVPEDDARRVVLEALTGPARPGDQPAFPGAAFRGQGAARQLSGGGLGPRLPGTLPPVWNVPARNMGFTGRDLLLVRLRGHLLAGDRAVVQVLRGLGGVGKTQLAAEYAHRFASSYDIVWRIEAEQAALIAGQMAALGTRLGAAGVDAPASVAAEAAVAELRARSRWLLVFDNAVLPQDLMPWLPGGSTGHVLITTRTGGWSEVAPAPVEIDVFARTESVAVLRERVPGLSEVDAGLLAEELGDLPLGVAQAASYLADSGMPATEYVGLVQTRAARILNQGRVTSYPRSLAGATQMTVEALSGNHASAATLAEIAAFLAPEPIPLALFTTDASLLPEPLAAAVADVFAWRDLLAALGNSSLARVEQRTMQMHRLTQAILRDRLSLDRAESVRACAGAVLAAGDPGSADDPASWSAWAGLLPHLLAIDPASSNDPAVRNLACNAAWYLLMRGDARAGYSLSSQLYRHWKQQLGSHDHHTLWAANSVAQALRQLGRYPEARRLDEKTVIRRRRTMGEDNLNTLVAVGNLSNDLHQLGEYQAARELDEDTLTRCRRLLGEDHPHTLGTASNLANNLCELGEYQAARELDEDTLARRRRVLGEDHPETLRSVDNLAVVLREMSEYKAARELDEDARARGGRVQERLGRPAASKGEPG